MLDHDPQARARNPGTPLALPWLSALRVEPAAVDRRVRDLLARRPIAPSVRGAWLRWAVRCLDLTSLSADDTPETIAALCRRARRPLPETASGGPPLRPAAVCVYPAYVEQARRALEGSGVAVATVAAGFPDGLASLPERVAEVRACARSGADEIDVVIRRSHVLGGRWQALYDEVAAFRAAAGPARLKVILSTRELGSVLEVARASLVCMMAGSDFLKTSTGKGVSQADLGDSLTMLRAIRAYQRHTGYAVGFKPAGGIRRADSALAYLTLVRDELGPEALDPRRFRLGASTLCDDLARALQRLPPSP